MKYFTFPAEFLVDIISIKRCHPTQLALYRGPGVRQPVGSDRRFCSFFYHLCQGRFLHELAVFIVEINVVGAFAIRMLYPVTDGRMAAP